MGRINWNWKYEVMRVGTDRWPTLCSGRLQRAPVCTQRCEEHVDDEPAWYRRVVSVLHHFCGWSDSLERTGGGAGDGAREARARARVQRTYTALTSI